MHKYDYFINFLAQFTIKSFWATKTPVTPYFVSRNLLSVLSGQYWSQRSKKLALTWLNPYSALKFEWLKDGLKPCTTLKLQCILTTYPSFNINWFKIGEGIRSISILSLSNNKLGNYFAYMPMTWALVCQFPKVKELIGLALKASLINDKYTRAYTLQVILRPITTLYNFSSLRMDLNIKL